MSQKREQRQGSPSTPRQNMNFPFGELEFDIPMKLPKEISPRLKKKNSENYVMDYSSLRKNSLEKFGRDFINSPDSPNYFPKKSNSSERLEPTSNFHGSKTNLSIDIEGIGGMGYTRSACTSPTTKPSSVMNTGSVTPSDLKKTNSFNEENDYYENRSKRAISFSTKTSLAFEFSKSQSMAQMKLNLIRIQVCFEFINHQTIDDVKLYEKELKKSTKPPKG
jgi:hypothetical protein